MEALKGANTRILDKWLQLRKEKLVSPELRREILRMLGEERGTIVRRASVPPRAVIYEANPELLNRLYAEFDNFVVAFNDQVKSTYYKEVGR